MKLYFIYKRSFEVIKTWPGETEIRPEMADAARAVYAELNLSLLSHYLGRNTRRTCPSAKEQQLGREYFSIYLADEDRNPLANPFGWAAIAVGQAPKCGDCGKQTARPGSGIRERYANEFVARYKLAHA